MFRSLLKLIGLKKEKAPKKLERWNELPPELKQECIKNMDFKTRCLLRQTSKNGRENVDLLFISFFKITIAENSVRLGDQSEEETYTFDCANNDHIQCLSRILKKCNIECLHVDNNTISIEIMQQLFGSQPLRVRHFLGVSSDLQQSVFLLEQIWEKIQLVGTVFSDSGNLIQNYFSIPSLRNASQFFFLNVLEDHAIFVIEQWTQLDLKIGATLEMVSSDSMFQRILKTLETRQVSFTDTKLRIRTNNPEKHIVFSLEDNFGDKDLKTVYIASDAQVAMF